MNIYISGIGGPTPRSIAHVIRKKFPKAKIIGGDLNPKALGFYIENLVDARVLVPKANTKDYWPTIKKIISEYNIDLAFIQPEREVLAWAKYFIENGEYPCPVLVPPHSHVSQLANKSKMAELLSNTSYIPKTTTIVDGTYQMDKIEEIGFPCWIRASEGSGGFGSLKLNTKSELDAWLFINKEIKEFTLSEFLPGRHLANQMLYIDGKLIKNAGLECVDYVMANVAPSRVTGNTSFGRMLNEPKLLEFCEEVMNYISQYTKNKPNGVYSFDLKEDKNGSLKVTEINIRHMAYTGILAEIGFDLVSDTIDFLLNKTELNVCPNYFFDADYCFLRDVDERPIIMKESDLLRNV